MMQLMGQLRLRAVPAEPCWCKMLNVWASQQFAEGAEILGNELWVQPSFADSTGVTLTGSNGFPPVISGGVLTFDPAEIGLGRASANALEALEVGNYRVTYDVLSIGVENVFARLANNTGIPRTAPGSYSEIIACAAANQVIALQGTSSDAVIDNFSVKRIQ